MSGLNRGRLAVDPDGNWRLYTNSIPGGCTVLGVVTRDAETGVLVRTEAGIYSMLNARVYRSLDQRKVQAALVEAGVLPAPLRGRPTLDDGGRDGRLNMRVRPDDKEAWRQAAAQAGDKDLSAWIERVLNKAARAA